MIKTTIETGEEATVDGFALISRFDYNRKGSMHAERLRYLKSRSANGSFAPLTRLRC